MLWFEIKSMFTTIPHEHSPTGVTCVTLSLSLPLFLYDSAAFLITQIQVGFLVQTLIVLNTLKPLCAVLIITPGHCLCQCISFMSLCP